MSKTNRYAISSPRNTRDGWAVKVTDTHTGRSWTHGVWGSYEAACFDIPAIARSLEGGAA